MASDGTWVTCDRAGGPRLWPILLDQTATELLIMTGRLWHEAVRHSPAVASAESVTLGRKRKRKRWDSPRRFTPDTTTLGILGMELTHYTLRQQGSILAGAYDAFSDAGESTQD